MGIHPDTDDGYFVTGDPFTGSRPPGSVPQVEFFNALLDMIDGYPAGPPTPVVAETTLDANDRILFVSAAAPLHLPIYATVGAGKQYTVKCIDGDLASIVDAADGKLINGQAQLPLNPGDCFTLAKDGNNWQTLNI